MQLELLTKDDLLNLVREVVLLREEVAQVRDLMQPNERLFKSQQVMQWLGISENCLRHYRVSMGLPFIRIQGTVRYKYTDLIAWLDKHRIAYDTASTPNNGLVALSVV